MGETGFAFSIERNLNFVMTKFLTIDQ
jgi:hypothetical protein